MSKFKEIILERTPNFGVAPVYKVVIDSKGLVRYSGKSFVSRLGYYQWSISEVKIEELNRLISEYNNFKMKEKKATRYATCHATCIITITMEDGTYRKIEDYLGANKYPKKLRVFEEVLNKTVGVDEYVKTKLYLFLISETPQFQLRKEDCYILSAANEKDALDFLYKNNLEYHKQTDDLSNYYILRLSQELRDRWPIIYASYNKKFFVDYIKLECEDIKINTDIENRIYQVNKSNAGDNDLLNYSHFVIAPDSKTAGHIALTQIYNDINIKINIIEMSKYAAKESINPVILTPYRTSFNPNIKINNDSILFKAIDKGNVEMIDLLVKSGADVNFKNEVSNTALMKCARKDKGEYLKILIEKGAIVDEKNINGSTALALATQSRCINAVKYLVQNGADINIQNSEGMTPIMIAAKKGYRELVELFLNYSANVTLKQNEGLTALELALKQGFNDIADIINRHHNVQ
ncbi:MAG: ankyrin repeat domain-containing protein [Clostridia bacterium]|nr:ankyrin repeat domain-containing protein [Clostridia bacterium]